VRADYETARAELERAWKALEPYCNADGFSVPTQVAVFDLAELVVEHPLVREAVGSACIEPEWDHDELEANTIQRLRDFLPGMVEVGRAWDKLVNRLYEAHGRSEPFESSLASVKTRRSWLGSEREVGDILRRLSHDSDELEVRDYEFLGHNVLMIAGQGIGHLKRLGPAQEDAEGLSQVLHGIKSEMLAVAKAYRELSSVARSAELRFVLQWLEQVHERKVQLREGRPGPLPVPLDDPLKRGPIARPLHSVARLVARARARLATGVHRQYAVRRLVTFLERFERGALRQRIASGERGPEAVVQHTVDQFLFLEGLFPITHCVAGAGNLDTVYERQEILLDEAERTRQGAVLLELKQCVKKPPTAEALAKKVAEAIEQAEHYRRHVAARPRWRDHEVYVIVVYAGDRRYRCERGDVELVYVGETPPSDGAVLIDVPVTAGGARG